MAAVITAINLDSAKETIGFSNTSSYLYILVIYWPLASFQLDI